MDTNSPKHKGDQVVIQIGFWPVRSIIQFDHIQVVRTINEEYYAILLHQFDDIFLRI